eukprot:TRINITY_DN67110_c9_g2_i1.p1 TRINITY_DN67110_c9_g2~~TRINITY_DN67110_c9_g2_i1.p1  ORF type:complete len:410 (-),score=13.28 TRINITY_DN67110_c9_g2_i1:274-1503(-)
MVSLLADPDTEIVELQSFQPEEVWSWRVFKTDDHWIMDPEDPALIKIFLANFTREELRAMCIYTETQADAPQRFYAYAASHWPEFPVANTRVFARAVRQGIPHECRKEVWQCIVGSRERQARYPTLYKKLRESPSNNEKAITRDIHRTFPTEPYFSDPDGEGQKALYNVLNAYASFDNKVGYAQGMAFVVGLLLLYMDEESAFWVFASAMQEDMYKLRVLYGPGVSGFHLLIYQIQSLVEKYFPKAHTHLESEHFGADVYAPPYIPSLFMSRVSREVAARILDIFLVDGVIFIPRLFLALMKAAAPTIVSSPAEMILQILNGITEHQLNDPSKLQEILESSFTFPVTYDTLKELELEYWRTKMETQTRVRAASTSPATSPAKPLSRRHTVAVRPVKTEPGRAARHSVMI